MKKTTSPYITVKNSAIHSQGVFAKKDIPDSTEIIEYVGEKITKRESDIRGEKVLSRSKNDVTRGAVYIFDLNGRHDIDGNVPWNTAGIINHTCDPNCEAVNIDGHIWICAMRDIEKGEELSYNYGYNFDNWQEHPCRCGADYCIGYILAEEHWPELLRELARRKKNKGV
ncbi:MAG: SET domain-containing protein [candidate division Zixibacteria bacterium]|nr:SET domain-containing protein [candidate division Zixibacteria bacterium]